MNVKKSVNWKQTIQSSLVGGAVVVFLALVGVIETFGKRPIVSGVISMGQILLLLPLIFWGFYTGRQIETKSKTTLLLVGGISGLTAAVVIVFLILTGQVIDLRAMFINASPALNEMLTFGQGLAVGLIVLGAVGFFMGGLGASFHLLSSQWQKTILQAIFWVIIIGLLRDLITTVISRWGPVAYLIRWMFASAGLTIPGAVVLTLIIGGLTFWQASRSEALPTHHQRVPRWATIGVTTIILLILPLVLGIFFSEILDNVGIYILMGLGLNIVVGFAGLLDLGYVAFYAIGAYTIGVLTSPELGFYNLSYWQALPFALGIVVLAGFILGLPVLKMRGDYLAIVTLGFGEIIRLLALSDWLRPWLGGTQGIQQIAHPKIGPWTLSTQTQLYYLILAGIAIAGFIAWRLKDSRMGRSWMALREDEDVAQAMGINLVATKLLAFATGAFFAGLSGTIFASKITAVYPHSFNLLVSINALCLIIVGGMGSIPGVLVGSLALMGLPELLREFAEFRYLVYGAVLVAMMLMRPEGLWPEERRKLELHEEESATVISPAD